jgi:hypothetical protein
MPRDCTKRNNCQKNPMMSRILDYWKQINNDKYPSAEVKHQILNPNHRFTLDEHFATVPTKIRYHLFINGNYWNYHLNLPLIRFASNTLVSCTKHTKTNQKQNNALCDKTARTERSVSLNLHGVWLTYQANGALTHQ